MTVFEDDDSFARDMMRRFNQPAFSRGKESLRGLRRLNDSVLIAASRIPNLDKDVARRAANASSELDLADEAHENQDFSKTRGHMENAANHISDAATMIVGQGQSALDNLTTVPSHLDSAYYTPEASLHMLEGQEATSNLMDAAHMGKAQEHVKNYVDSLPKGK